MQLNLGIMIMKHPFYVLFYDCHRLLVVLHLGISGALLRRLSTRSCSGLAFYIYTLVFLGAYGDEYKGKNPAESVGALIEE